MKFKNINKTCAVSYVTKYLQNLSVITSSISSRKRRPNARKAKGKTTIGGRAETPKTPSKKRSGPNNFPTVDLIVDLKALVMLKKAPELKNKRLFLWRLFLGLGKFPCTKLKWLLTGSYCAC